MKIMLNGQETVVLEDRLTIRGHQMISCSANSIKPSKGLTVFFEHPAVGAHPWISYVRMGEDGKPDLASTPATRMPLNKSRITSITFD